MSDSETRTVDKLLLLSEEMCRHVELLERERNEMLEHLREVHGCDRYHIQELLDKQEKEPKP